MNWNGLGVQMKNKQHTLLYMQRVTGSFPLEAKRKVLFFEILD